MNLNPFRTPSPVEHNSKRVREAQALVDHHVKRAAEMNDTMQWALAQEQHHKRMANMYSLRVKTIKEQQSCTSTESPDTTATKIPSGWAHLGKLTP